MYYRTLGRTGIKVSEISTGCNRLGQEIMPDEHWVALVHKAVALGVNLFDFSSARIIERVEGSLRRLRRDRIDVLQLHSPSLDDLKRYDWPEAMTKLKEQGKIRFAGVSINGAASGRWLIEQGLVEVLQVAYNMLVPEVDDEVFPLAE